MTVAMISWRGYTAAMGSALADLLLPAICPACDTAAGPALCSACLARVEPLRQPCHWCAAPGGGATTRCGVCDNRGLAHIRRVYIDWVYAGVVKQLVNDAKAGGRAPAGRALGTLLPTVPDTENAMVVPVPPSPGRRSGPHLGTMLARSLARRHGLPMRLLLRLTRLVVEQHRLSHGERARNVMGLFVSRPAPERVLLVDDLMTSGATASAAAAALRHAGAKHIDLICVARTPRHGD